MKRSGYAGLCFLTLLGMGTLVRGGETYGQPPYVGVEIIEPAQIQVGSFFHGRDLKVRAIFPGDCQLALRILGPREDLKLMRKERVGGIWMNVEQVTFANIPKVYLLWTSGKPFGDGEKTLRELNFDYSSVVAGSLPGPTQEKNQFLVRELVKLKEQDHLYNISEGTIRTRPLEKGFFSQAEAVLHLPAKIYPGSYSLELIAFKDGKSSLLHTYPLKVQLTGLPAALTRLANENGLLYGLLAVGIAVLCGLVMGIFMSSRGGH